MKKNNSLSLAAQVGSHPLGRHFNLLHFSEALRRGLHAFTTIWIVPLVALSLSGIALSVIADTLELPSLNGSDGFTFSHISTELKEHVAGGTGDFNGDGVDDIVMKTRFDEDFGPINRVYVVFGGAEIGANREFDLANINGSNGFAFLDRASSIVKSFGVGDLNNDGIDDLVLGAPDHGFETGHVYVIFGDSDVGAGGSMDYRDLNGQNGFLITAADPASLNIAGGSLGLSVSAVGDLNGDGIDDLVIGEPRDSTPGTSVAFVIFGANGLGASGSFDLASINGSNGFIINGENDNDDAGRTVSTSGDVNGDGINDILIGARLARDSVGVGAIYVVFGASDLGITGSLELSALDGAKGFVAKGISSPTDSSPGLHVSILGDINNDGVDDFATISNREEFMNNYVVFGANNLGEGGTFDLSLLNGSNGFVFNGFLDVAVSGAGDFNGDGIDDMLVGNSFSPIKTAYLIFGASNIGGSGALDLFSVLGSRGITLNGDDVGRTVSSAGDLNNDGLDDLHIGASATFLEGDSGYIVFGRNSDPVLTTTFDTQIEFRRGDVEESPSGTVNYRSSDLDLGEKLTGLRFTSVDIPAGVTITKAYIQFKADETNVDPASFQLMGEASDNSLVVESSSKNISSRAKTNASMAWSPGSWLDGNSSESQRTEQQSSDISAIVQEIVDRPGWSHGNALMIMVSGNSGKRVAVSYDADHDEAPSLHVEYNFSGVISPSTQVSVSAAADDAEEGDDGLIQLSSSDLELGFNKTKQQTVGMRFNAVNVPGGATITKAYIQFQADETDSVATSLLIEGEATDHAQAYTSLLSNISTRIRTQATIAWSPPSWTSIGEAGPNQQTPDITSIVQEIINRPGWVSGNALGIVVTGSGQRTAESYDGNRSAAPLLHLEYTLP